MKKQVINYQELNGLVAKICRDISIDNWRPDYIVGLTRGGLIPATMISHYLNIPMHTLKVSLRDNVDTESNCWVSEDALGYIPLEDRKANGGWSSLPSKRKNILIVDDINDTGATLNWIMQDWQSSCMPEDKGWSSVWNQNVKFAVLVDNLSSQCNVKMDYIGFEVNKAEKDVWIDFPWENWWAK